ncbi:MAG TPA: nicotinate-nucleotide--dimethylbenzimidazole phosphoribosyltransferase [Dehalococcoidia bacterium]|nr:nicotinate-nucleotide--dimethylbenzimidazole phosphoribosyltransferase [Dehalococcoidia bacterium]
MSLAEVMERIGLPDEGAMAAARQRLDRLTKPPGSLGRLEELAVWLAGVTGRVRQRLDKRTVVLMAADHGVVAEGVSAYPPTVTAQMVANFLRGGAAINVLARQARARVLVVDVGVAADLAPSEGLLVRKVAKGTRNLARGPAMTREEALQAIEVGIEVAGEEIARGAQVLATGDMGIGNTTPSAAIIAVLTGRPVAQVTGRGTGLDDEGLRRKVAVIEAALALHRPDPSDPLDVLTKVGGYEIAALAGLCLRGAAERVPVVLDGLIAGAAALVAVRLCPRARHFLLASHCSAEPGHRYALEAMGLRPLLDLDMRLGEGTGACLALHLADAALAIVDEMATFEEAGVDDRA